MQTETNKTQSTLRSIFLLCFFGFLLILSVIRLINHKQNKNVENIFPVDSIIQRVDTIDVYGQDDDTLIISKKYF